MRLEHCPLRLGRVPRHVQRHVVRMKHRKKGRPRIEDRARTIEALETLAQARNVAADMVPPSSRTA